MSQTKLKNLWGWGFYVDTALGIYPRFSIELKKRIKQKKGTNIMVGGESGIGKTYLANDICRMLSRFFTIHQVVFTYREFMVAILETKMGVPVVFDEPSYAMGKREWYNDINKALVKTIESFRFMVHPLFIPVINKSLLDKTIRKYLLHFQVQVHDRGIATAYRLYPSPFQDKTYQYFFCNLRYPLFDKHLCVRNTCLDCSKLNDEKNLCMVFRAQYERKKAQTQEERYQTDLEDAENIEYSQLSINQLENKILPLIDKCLSKDGTINVSKMKTILNRKLNIRIGNVKAYDLKALIAFDYPEYSKDA